MIVRVALAAILLLCAGCENGFIPKSGPDRDTVLKSAATTGPDLAKGEIPYALVPLTRKVVNEVNRQDEPLTFAPWILGGRRYRNVIERGDTLTITIFESQPGGLFVPQNAGSRQGNFVQLPPQQVGPSATVSVPFVGEVRAAGETPAQIQRTITDQLAARAIEPQVIVSITQKQSDFVSVLGEVATAQRFSLDPEGDRLLGAIARAGGPRYPTYESIVSLQRAGQSYRALLSSIAEDPKQNIELWPDDVVIVTHEPRHFTALGALGQTTSVAQIDRRFTFGAERLSLIDAIGRAGGLTDDQANPRAIFLFRSEAPGTLRSVGVPVAQQDDSLVPTVYVADLMDPATFFLARQFPMRDGDSLYVSNAPATDIGKFLNLVLPGASTGSAIRGTINP